MKFVITRTSLGHCSTEPPAPGAVMTSGSEDELDEKTWEIELATLEDVLALAKAQGGKVILDARDNSVEVYDDWRE